MKSRAPCAVFSASMGSFLGWVPSPRRPPGEPPGNASASSPRPQQHQDGGRGAAAAAGPGLRLRAVRLLSSGRSRDMVGRGAGTPAAVCEGDYWRGGGYEELGSADPTPMSS